MNLSLVETVNPYMYCGNNPISFTDPTGLLDEHVLVEQENYRYRADVAQQEAASPELKEQRDANTNKEWQQDVVDKVRDAHDAFDGGDEKRANDLLLHAYDVSSWSSTQPGAPKIPVKPTYGLTAGISLEKEGFSIGPLGISFGVSNEKAYGGLQLFLFQYEAGYDFHSLKFYDQLDLGMSLRLGPAWVNWSATTFTKELWSTIGDY